MNAREVTRMEMRAVHGMEAPNEIPTVFLQLQSFAGIGEQVGTFVTECVGLVGWGLGTVVLVGGLEGIVEVGVMLASDGAGVENPPGIEVVDIKMGGEVSMEDEVTSIDDDIRTALE